MSKKYYFIVYQWTTSDGTKEIEQCATKKHPLDWQLKWREKAPKEHYTVTFWSEITEELYKEHRYNLG